MQRRSKRPSKRLQTRRGRSRRRRILLPSRSSSMGMVVRRDLLSRRISLNLSNLVNLRVDIPPLLNSADRVLSLDHLKIILRTFNPNNRTNHSRHNKRINNSHSTARRPCSKTLRTRATRIRRQDTPARPRPKDTPRSGRKTPSPLPCNNGNNPSRPLLQRYSPPSRSSRFCEYPGST